MKNKLSFSQEDAMQMSQKIISDKKRLREKQMQLLELMKQRIAIEKIKLRNITFINDAIMCDDMNLNMAMEHNSANRLQLPLLLIEIPSDSRVNISQDVTKSILCLQSDKNFTLRDENALFQCMGLMKTSDDELKRIFQQDLLSYLKDQMLVEVPTVRPPALTSLKEQPGSDEKPQNTESRYTPTFSEF